MEILHSSELRQETSTEELSCSSDKMTSTGMELLSCWEVALSSPSPFWLATEG